MILWRSEIRRWWRLRAGSWYSSAWKIPFSIPVIQIFKSPTPSSATADPFLTVAFLQTGQSAKSRSCELEVYKAAIGDLTQSANFRQSASENMTSLKVRSRRVTRRWRNRKILVRLVICNCWRACKVDIVRIDLFASIHRPIYCNPTLSNAESMSSLKTLIRHATYIMR